MNYKSVLSAAIKGNNKEEREAAAARFVGETRWEILVGKEDGGGLGELAMIIAEEVFSFTTFDSWSVLTQDDVLQYIKYRYLPN